MIYFRIFFIISLIACPMVLRADIYKYTDDNGVVHFTNVKPPEGVGEVHVWRKR